MGQKSVPATSLSLGSIRVGKADGYKLRVASFQEQQLKKQVNALQKEIGAKMKVNSLPLLFITGPPASCRS